MITTVHCGDNRWMVLERDKQGKVIDRLDCTLNELEPNPEQECARLWALYVSHPRHRLRVGR